MSYLLLQANARRIPLKDKSVHCVVTSPPYWGLRDYKVPGQLGLEPSPELYVAHMVEVFREVWRVLRDDGTLWVNMGDSFASSGKMGSSAGLDDYARRVRGQKDNGPKCGARKTGRAPTPEGMKSKNMIGIPWRLAFALQADGWYLRSDCPWFKRSPMPSSVTDRPGMAHEYVFLLSKRPRYYFDPVAVQRAAAATTVARDAYTRITSGKDGQYAVAHDHETPSEGVRNFRTSDFFRDGLDDLIAQQEEYLAHLRTIRDKGGLLTTEDGDPLAFLVAATPFAGSHYAVMPERIVREAIRASTSERGCCRACGAQWMRITEKESFEPVDYNGKNRGLDPQDSARRMLANMRARRIAGHPHNNPFPAPRTKGWCPACDCDAGTPVPSHVFDPFSGAGTTPLEALKLGRIGIGTELSREFLDMARRRIERPHAPIRPNGTRHGDDLPLFAGLEDDV